MSYLTKEQILAAEDLQYEAVDVPEWGGSLLIWELTGAERNAFELSAVPGAAKGDNTPQLLGLRERLLVLSIKDGDGQRIFEDNDIAILQSKNAEVIDRLFSVAQRLNGLSAQDVEQLEKNSAAVPSNGSGTD